MRDALDRSGFGNFWQRRAHRFADDQLLQFLALPGEGQDLVFVGGADRKIFLEHRNLRNVLLLHGFERVKNGLVWAHDNQFANFAGFALGVDHIGRGDGHWGVDVAAFAIPFFVVALAEVAHASVRQESNDVGFFVERFREAQRGGKAAATAAAGEKTFLLDQAASDHEALFVVDLDNVVQNLHVHGVGKKIFADAFHHVGAGFADLPGFVKFIVQRALGIDADDLNGGIFFLEKFAGAADGAAGAHAANEVSDFSFGVFPDFRAGGGVV